MNGIAAVARVPEHLDVFWVAGDGRVNSSWWHQGEPWSGSFSVGGFFPAGAPIAAVSRRPDHLDLFVVGNDGRVYTSWWHDGQVWSGGADNWTPIGGFFPVGASITAVSRNADHLDVFVMGNDGRVYTSWWHAGSDWSGAADSWTSIGGFFPSTAALSSIARYPDHLDLFVTGNDGRVYTSWWHEGQAWSGVNNTWTSLGGYFPAGNAVSVSARTPDNLDVFVVGNDGRVYTSWWSAGQPWSGVNDTWTSLGGFFPVKASVASVSRGPGNLDLFIVGNDGRVYTSWWSAGQSWSGVNDSWTGIGGFFPPGTQVVPLARIADHLDLFVTGNDGLVYSSWWHAGNGWSGAADNWFTINVHPGPRIRLQDLHVEKAQEDDFWSDGDEPYLVTIGFRSKFRTPGSTQVWWSGDLHELGDLDSGDSVGLPPSMGYVEFPNLRIVSRDDLMRLDFPEVFGAFTLVLESDATPFDLLRPKLGELRGVLQQEITRLIENGQLISDFTAPQEQITAEVSANLQAALNNTVAAFNFSFTEKLLLFVSSFGDPDDFIGFHGFVFAGVDDSLAGLLPSMSSAQLQIGRFTPGSVDFKVDGDSARYRVTGVLTS